MSKDIAPVMAGWDYEPDEFQVRIVTGDDGRDKIQMRIDLGLIQMEMSGRPDGVRPVGFDSVLDQLEDRARAALAAGEEFVLEPPSCAELMREGVQYYRRYLAAFHLQRYDLAERDTERNLRLFRFAVKYAVLQRDKLQFDQFRPYVTMMWTRARAHQALSHNDHRAALEQIDRGAEDIRAFLREYGQDEREDECRELEFLLRWRRDIETERPLGPLERLEQQLGLAVALEDYEEAARIRDQLQRLKGEPVPSGNAPEISGGHT